MTNKMFGLVHDFYPRDRLISIIYKGRVLYFYYPKTVKEFINRAMHNKFVFIEFMYDENIKVIKGCIAHNITDVQKISYTSNRGLITIYSGSVTDENIRNAINKKSYRMFMDLELTMPEFGESKPFKPEILQMGCVVIDEDDNIVNYYSNYVKTKKKISTRTYRFLSLGPEATDEAIPFEELYKDYSNLIDIYNPDIYVWGKNDISALQSTYIKYKMKQIKANYIDLSELILKHHKLHNELSLFKALLIYKGINAKQVHDALVDAQATKEVYDEFKKDINGELDFDLKEEVAKLSKHEEK